MQRILLISRSAGVSFIYIIIFISVSLNVFFYAGLRCIFAFISHIVSDVLFWPYVKRQLQPRLWWHCVKVEHVHECLWHGKLQTLINTSCISVPALLWQWYRFYYQAYIFDLSNWLSKSRVGFWIYAAFVTRRLRKIKVVSANRLFFVSLYGYHSIYLVSGQIFVFCLSFNINKQLRTLMWEKVKNTNCNLNIYQQLIKNCCSIPAICLFQESRKSLHLVINSSLFSHNSNYWKSKIVLPERWLENPDLDSRCQLSYVACNRNKK